MSQVAISLTTTNTSARYTNFVTSYCFHHSILFQMLITSSTKRILADDFPTAQCNALLLTAKVPASDSYKLWLCSQSLGQRNFYLNHRHNCMKPKKTLFPLKMHLREYAYSSLSCAKHLHSCTIKVLTGEIYPWSIFLLLSFHYSPFPLLLTTMGHEKEKQSAVIGMET